MSRNDTNAVKASGSSTTPVSAGIHGVKKGVKKKK